MFHLTSCHLTISDKNRNGHEKSCQVLINIQKFAWIKVFYQIVDYFVLEMCLKPILRNHAIRQYLLEVVRTTKSCPKHKKLLISCRAQSGQA